jgi:hypothetical protein
LKSCNQHNHFHNIKSWSNHIENTTNHWSIPGFWWLIILNQLVACNHWSIERLEVFHL